MAEIVLGIGTSHSPVLALTPDIWPEYSSNDPNNRELISPKTAKRTPYDELLKEADPSYASRINAEQFQSEHERLQRGIAEVRQTLQVVLRSPRCPTVAETPSISPWRGGESGH